MKTKRTDMTPQEIEAAEKLGICTLTPDEMQEERWQNASMLGKVISLDAFAGLFVALVIGAWLLSVFRSASEGDKKEGGNES